jgi:glycosyltransferase involved in cell wall biosynthesis
VEFAGRVSEEKAVQLYAGALAVFYAPVDEDYGYGTLEGMRSRKPVLTAPDSGGVLEFVHHGENGFVCRSPAEFAAALDRLYTDRTLTHKLGETAYQTSLQIPTWSEVAAILTGSKI